MPQLGESVAEGTIGKWLKKPGDHVDKYEPLLEVITDKVNAEVPSPFAGTLAEILVEEGATVPNNAEIAIIDEGGSADAAAPAAAAPAAAAAPTAAVAASAPASEPASATAAPAPVSAPAAVAAQMASAGSPIAHGPAGSDERTVEELPGSADARMTPAVRRLLREHGLNPATIVGT